MDWLIENATTVNIIASICTIVFAIVAVGGGIWFAVARKQFKKDFAEVLTELNSTQSKLRKLDLPPLSPYNDYLSDLTDQVNRLIKLASRNISIDK